MNQSRTAKQGCKGNNQSRARHRTHCVSDAPRLREVNLFPEEISPDRAIAGPLTNSKSCANVFSGRAGPLPMGPSPLRSGWTRRAPAGTVASASCRWDRDPGQGCPCQGNDPGASRTPHPTLGGRVGKPRRPLRKNSRVALFDHQAKAGNPEKRPRQRRKLKFPALARILLNLMSRLGLSTIGLASPHLIQTKKTS